MQDLTPVRLTGGGKLLVLVDAAGVEYSVPLDARLRETMAPRPLGIQRSESTMESSLRPRDIQARIRAGESPEDVAAVAGTSVDRVMIFASPVLAERAHVAQGAQTASVRRRSEDPASTVRTLGPAAATRLRAEGVDPESVEWDAWRRDDGRWTLVATYRHDNESRRAGFSFDQPGHFVMPDDDEGRWLVGDGQFPTRAQKEEARQLALAPVPRYEEQVPLGDDAIELVRETPQIPEPDEVTGDADWIATPDRHADQGPIRPLSTQDPHLVHVDHSAHDQETLPGIDAPAQDEASAEEQDDPATQLPRRVSRKARGRASVPSWDEIMFGGGRGDEAQLSGGGSGD